MPPSQLARRPATTAMQRAYAPPGDQLVLTTNDACILQLADRLWSRADSRSGAEVGHNPISVRVEVESTTLGRAPVEHWEVTDRDAVVRFGRGLWAHVDFAVHRVSARVSRALVMRDPRTVVRLAVEAPAAELMARRSGYVLHAGAVTRDGRAVVIRGASGAGKSTLVAAAWTRGFNVLGDESILANRADPNVVSATVRELSLLPEAMHLVNGSGHGSVFTPRSGKYHAHLLDDSHPDRRLARRAATVLLGDRNRRTARLVSLTRAEFLSAFRAGEIEQERWAGNPDLVASAWASHQCYRMDGAVDLEGAVKLIDDLLQSGGAA
jgi:hypothetical protein